MGLRQRVRARLAEVRNGSAVAAGLQLLRDVADSGDTAVYVRQLLRGNHATRDVGGDSVAGPPVLLLHGYLATRGSLRLLERRLHERNHVVLSYPLGPINLGDIRESATTIARKVESVVAQTGVTKVDIVGHSMGGLVALYYVKRLGGEHRVRRLVLLGTPVRGTWSALFGLPAAPLGRASLQLLPGSPFLRELEDTPLPPGPEVISLVAERDWLAPIRRTVLNGARHIAVPTGHSGLLVGKKVAETVDDLLRAT